MNVGDKVEWQSQAAGSWRTKSGTVIDICPSNASLRRFIPEGISRRNIHASDRSLESRYVIEVVAPNGVKHIYAPLCVVIDNQRRRKVAS